MGDVEAVDRCKSEYASARKCVQLLVCDERGKSKNLTEKQINNLKTEWVEKIASVAMADFEQAQEKKS